MAEVVSCIEDNQFSWVLYEQTIPGVTLKHVVDNLFTHDDITNFDGTV